MDAKVGARSLLLVTKQYMERRALAAFEVQLPSKSTLLCVSSQSGLNTEYCEEDHKCDDVVDIMVGDFQRVIEYPQFGLRALQLVSDDVQGAFATLASAGFTRHVL